MNQNYAISFFLFLFFFGLVGVKAALAPVNHDYIFHFNHATNNFVDFDTKHPFESYVNRPPLVAWISQPVLFFGGVFGGSNFFFAFFWFLFIFLVFPVILFFLSNKNFLVFSWIWGFGFIYEFWFSGVFARFLSFILFLFLIRFLEKKSFYPVLGIFVLGFFTHTSFLLLGFFTCFFWLFWNNRFFLTRKIKIFLVFLGVLFGVWTTKILFILTIFGDLAAPFYLFVKNNGFRFWLMLSLFLVSWIVDIRVLTFAHGLLFFNTVEAGKRFFSEKILDYKFFFLLLILGLLQLFFAQTTLTDFNFR